MPKWIGFAAMTCAAMAGHAYAGEIGVYGTAGTLGFGGGIAASFTNQFGARVGYTTYEYSISDLEESDLRFDGEAEIGGAQAFLDWHPFGGAFRLSAGAVENASLTARAKPVSSTYTLNGVTYSADDVGETTGTAKYDTISPYVGLGFGHPLSLDGRLAFTADIGVILTGSPKVELNAKCAVPNAMLCSQIEADALAEQAELQKEADELEYWPLLSLGLSYRF